MVNDHTFALLNFGTLPLYHFQGPTTQRRQDTSSNPFFPILNVDHSGPWIPILPTPLPRLSQTPRTQVPTQPSAPEQAQRQPPQRQRQHFQSQRRPQQSQRQLPQGQERPTQGYRRPRQHKARPRQEPTIPRQALERLREKPRQSGQTVRQSGHRLRNKPQIHQRYPQQPRRRSQKKIIPQENQWGQVHGRATWPQPPRRRQEAQVRRPQEMGPRWQEAQVRRPQELRPSRQKKQIRRQQESQGRQGSRARRRQDTLQGLRSRGLQVLRDVQTRSQANVQKLVQGASSLLPSGLVENVPREAVLHAMSLGVIGSILAI